MDLGPGAVRGGLFAYLGHSILPSITFQLEEKRRIVKVVAIGIALPCLLYLIWSLVAMGVIPASAEDGPSLSAALSSGHPATTPLGFVVGGSVVVLGNIFAAFSTLTSYTGFGISLRDSYEDVAHRRQRRTPTLVLTGLVVVPPLLLALLFPGAFVKMLDLAGMFGGGLFVGVLPVLMVLRLRRDPAPRPFSTWGGPVLPYIVLAVYAWGMFRTLAKFLG